MGGNVFLHLLYPAAVRESLYLGKRRTGQHPGIVIEGKFVKDTEKVHHGIKALLLGSQLVQPVVHLHDGLHGEAKSALCTLQHPTNTVELVLVDDVPEEQVGRELDGNLPNISGGTFMLLPYVLQLLTGYQHQVIITDNLGRIAYHAADTGSMFRKVQFIFCMAMDGVGEFCFVTVGNIETVTFRQRGYLPHDIVLVFHRHWLKSIMPQIYSFFLIHNSSICYI